MQDRTGRYGLLACECAAVTGLCYCYTVSHGFSRRAYTTYGTLSSDRRPELSTDQRWKSVSISASPESTGIVGSRPYNQPHDRLREEKP
ncbi:hypothetical protein BaRGS_00022168 [Batillaria attramentaria]|uniref:Secreted protein n=1 Tax=Batillaria attramentaria TaxID=370345 RepID=A0ABD0KHU2_9CAEN